MKTKDFQICVLSGFHMMIKDINAAFDLELSQIA